MSSNKRSRSVSRGRRSMRSPSATPKKKVRIMSTSRSASRGRSRSTKPIVSGIRSGAANDADAPQKRSGKKAITAPKKKLKLNPQFVKNVKEVVNEKYVLTGTHVEFFTEAVDVTARSNEQNCTSIPNNGTAVAGHLFTPEKNMYSIARLYGKAVATRVPVITDATMFQPPSNYTFDVRSQTCTYNLKNNTNRIVHLRFYVCQPKIQQNAGDPLTQFTQAITQGVADGSLGAYLNTPALTVNTLQFDPRKCAQWSKAWKTETTDFIMDPGQTAAFEVKSEGGHYDMKKFYTQSTYQQYNKKGRYVFMTSYVDLANGSDGLTGRLGLTKAGEYLVVETKTTSVYLIPEQMGFVLNTLIGDNQELNKRIRKYAVDHYGTTLEVLALQRVDENNPALQTEV